ELDVLESDNDLVVFPGLQLSVARGGIDDLARIKADRLAHHARPSQVVGLGNDLGIGPGRPRSEHEWVFELHAADRGPERDRHDILREKNIHNPSRRKGCKRAPVFVLFRWILWERPACRTLSKRVAMKSGKLPSELA